MFLARLFETTALVTVFEMQDNFSLVKEKNVKDVLMFSFAYSTAFRRACQILKPTASFVSCFAQASTESRS